MHTLVVALGSTIAQVHRYRATTCPKLPGIIEVLYGGITERGCKMWFPIKLNMLMLKLNRYSKLNAC